MNTEDLKWNKMVGLWGDFKLESPYEELMTYWNEVNNGGHYQFFDNVSGRTDLTKSIKNLLGVLPSEFKPLVEKAFKMYEKDPDDENDELSDFLDQCDDFFYRNEEKITEVLQNYANTLSL